jgi:hypothetical protein
MRPFIILMLLFVIVGCTQPEPPRLFIVDGRVVAVALSETSTSLIAVKTQDGTVKKIIIVGKPGNDPQTDLHFRTALTIQDLRGRMVHVVGVHRDRFWIATSVRETR